MRHHYISVAVFGVAFGIATAVTILVIGRAISPQVVTMAASPPPAAVQPPVQPQQVVWSGDPWSHRHWHWHWRWDGHDLADRIRAQVMSELDAAFDDVDDDDDVPVPPPVASTPVVVIRK